MTEGPSLKSVLVQGSLAYAMRRASAARDSEHGLQIMTAASLAARLAGGLLRPASRESIEVGVRTALARADLLDEIFPIRDLPGAARAVLRTLGDVWRAGYDLRSADAASKPRLRDLARIEDEMRLHLQPGELLLPDLCRLARQAVRFCPRVIGSLRLEGVHAVDPIWRPLINDLCDTIEVEWIAPPYCDAGWFEGRLRQAFKGQGTRRDISCADPYHEALEAMRWARALLSSGKAKAGEIAIATTAPFACDDYMLALATASSLPLSFVHGRPALATREGQRCAALADALQGGLGQARIRRLLALAANQGTVLDNLPDGHPPVSSEASLSSAADWERALAANPAASSILMPIIRLLEMGTSQAEAAGKLLLRGRARNLWDDALRAAPASALMFSLQALRVADERDPADSIAWCSVDQLAAAPRRFAWLMGLNTKSWPRNSSRDPMLPDYIVPRALIDPDPLETSDRRCFQNVLATAEVAVLSSARLSSDGKRIGQSTLQSATWTLDVVPRDRPALHALTEADRLLARPQDRADNPMVSSAMAAWSAWRSARLTPHDGMVGASHPALSSLLQKPQSPTSLSRLLRDPLAYVWHYALGWRDLVHKERGLVLPADDMGRLVHELLRRTVDSLEPGPGFKAAARHEIEDALAAAAAHVLSTWPLQTNVPPPVLWESTVRQAVKLSLAGLTFETLKEADTRSWTEVPFGGVAREAASSTPLPWDPEQPVLLAGTDICIQGTIDRLDLRTVAQAVRVTDYKTGQRPKAPDKINIGGGAELQRVLYSLACRQLLPDITRVAARLIYLRPPVEAYTLENGRQLGGLVANWVRQARIVLESGVIYPGVAVMPERFGKIALPASAGYIRPEVERHKGGCRSRPCRILGIEMTSRPDDRERWRALTDLEATLLVEASAGTGKTSLLAGRVVMLLAAGRLPSSIAAITFTERAAGELRERVDKFASMLINGMVPKDLAPAFSDQPLRDDQIKALRDARPQLGDLTASTIHSFCLEILQSYAVEARVDPGAVVMDAEQTDHAFKSIFDNWLGARLGQAARPDDPIVVMAADDPKLAVKTLTSLAKFRRSHSEARPLAPAAYGGLVHELFDAIAEFRRWISRVPAPDEASEDVTAFEELANAISDARSGRLPFSQLWALVQIKSPTLSRRDGHKLARYKLRQNHWDRSAGKSQGPLLTEKGRQHYERCARLFGDCMATIADTLLAGFFGETDGLLKAFETFKRDAAVLDFDDILMRTRDLLRSSEKVREDVAKRYRHILVDEYQDTDPVQTEILFLITSETGSAVAWEERIMRPGALFMVGDPKQAIYRFRGADLKTYLRARAAVETQFQGNVFQIKANFRSGRSILEHVDQVFAERLTLQQGGYVTLAATVAEDLDRIQSVARLSYDVAPNAYADAIRDVEAKAVAELCGRLIGNVMVRRSSGKIALAEPGDIALLAPRRTGLWRYERALEELAIPVASQAGKNLYRRQETQDFVALVRALADSRDTLALGAVLRGPLVGLTEKDLLDIATALKQHDEKAFLDLNTDLSLVHHPVAREVLTILQDLWQKRRSTTPHAILSEAIERLRAMPSIASRSDEERARSLGNIGALLEQTRSYHVRGLKQLAIDLAGDWDAGAPTDEAPSDAQRNSIDIVTVHKAKGLEWPVVIPINFVTMPEDANDFFHRSADNSVHWTLGDIISSTLDETVAADRAEAAQEHERLLYVACTRALDLLVLPAPGWSPPGGWAKFLDLGQASLAEIRHPASKPRNLRSPLTTSSQTSQLFAEESEHIEVSNPRIRWRRPSIDDVDRELIDRAGIDTSESGIQSIPDALVEGAGALRGIILHKLIEELLTQVVEPDPNHLEGRAQLLASQLTTADAARLDPAEMAATAMRTFTLPGLKPCIANMVPEIPLYGARSETLLVSARADAIAFDAGVAVAAFDWKSDIAPSPADRQAYAGQLLEYLELLALDRGAIVFMTSGEIQWVNRKRTTSDSE